MAARLFEREEERAGIRVCGDVVRLRTEGPVQFVDVTELVAERVRRSGVGDGLASVQSHHATAGIVVNEIERLDARCHAALLGVSSSLNVMDGRLVLGEGQRIFLVELDGPRPRSLSIVVMGAPREAE